MFTKIQIPRYENNCYFRSAAISYLFILFQRLNFCTGGKAWFHGNDNTCHLSQKVNISSKRVRRSSMKVKAKLQETCSLFCRADKTWLSRVHNKVGGITKFDLMKLQLSKEAFKSYIRLLKHVLGVSLLFVLGFLKRQLAVSCN